MKTGKMKFDSYHLSKSAYERSALNGGLEGTPTWRLVDSADIRRDVIKNLGKSSWSSFLTVPHFSTLVVAKA